MGNKPYLLFHPSPPPLPPLPPLPPIPSLASPHAASKDLEGDPSCPLALLLNNRAFCHLKNGDCRGCVEDSTRSLSLLPLNVKALIRRGSAYEMMEKYTSFFVCLFVCLFVFGLLSCLFCLVCFVCLLVCWCFLVCCLFVCLIVCCLFVFVMWWAYIYMCNWRISLAFLP